MVTPFKRNSLATISNLTTLVLLLMAAVVVTGLAVSPQESIARYSTKQNGIKQCLSTKATPDNGSRISGNTYQWKDSTVQLGLAVVVAVGTIACLAYIIYVKSTLPNMSAAKIKELYDKGEVQDKELQNALRSMSADLIKQLRNRNVVSDKMLQDALRSMSADLIQQLRNGNVVTKEMLQQELHKMEADKIKDLRYLNVV